MAESHTPLTTEFDLVRSALSAEYEILSEIGRGGMAIVYRAIEKELEREVALKVLPISLAGDGQMVERFLREARMAARLEHPHVVPIWRVGRAGGMPYIAMKLVHGPTLGDLLSSRGALPGAQVRRLLVETASALAHAHGCGIVHRDIKPDNILLEPDGRALVTDFGIARAAREGRLTASGTAIGTPRYMSPEQARAKSVDGRSDLYGLGVVAYECLTGRVPFDGPDPVGILLAHVEQPVPEPELHDPEARAIWPVVRRLLEKHPDDRFADARALLTALGIEGDTSLHSIHTQRLSTPPSFTPPPGRVGRAVRRVARHRLTAVVAIIVAAVGAALAFLPGAPTLSRANCPAGRPDSGWTVAVQPVAVARPGDFVEVTWDVCGLAANSATTTAVIMRPANPRLAGRDGRPSRTAYRDTLASGAVRRTRRIKIPAVPPGQYLLTVAVRPDGGRERSATTPLRVDWASR
jgi:hypothetical protein